MIKNWLIYLGAAAALFMFSVYHDYEQTTWNMFLLFVLSPLASLLLSLPFMILTVRGGIELSAPERLDLGETAVLTLRARSAKVFVVPMLRTRFIIRNDFSGDKLRCSKVFCGSFAKPFEIEDAHITRHCGNVDILPRRCFVCDFSGMFFIPLRLHGAASVTVVPDPVCPSVLPEIENARVLGFRPKPGGGFSDYYEVRSYQDGDSLKNIHWKLSGKYDELMVREPSLPVLRTLAVRLELTADPGLNDDILARFVYAAEHLAEANKDFLCLTPDSCIVVDSREEIGECVRRIYDRQPSGTPDLSGADLYTISAEGEEVAVS